MMTELKLFGSSTPKDWVTYKIAHGFGQIGSGTTPKSDSLEYYDGDIPWITTSELRENLISEPRQMITQKAIRDYSVLKYYPVGTLLIALYGATIGRMGILGIPATVNQACCALSEPSKFDIKFVYYWLWAFRPNLISLSSGGGQPNLSQEIIKSIRILCPGIELQQMIAAYLDTKTTQIDALIAKKQRQIELLKEKRSALITQAVTKGLDPTVKMKDSGVEWLGEIPEHWEAYQLKRVVERNTTQMDPGIDVPYIGLEHAESWTGKQIGFIEYSDVAGTSLLASKGDVLFGKLRPYLAKVLRPRERSACTGEYLVLRPKVKITTDFLFYLMLSEAFIDQVDSSTYGAKMPRASWESIGSLPVPVPDISEQERIVQNLENNLCGLDLLAKKVNSSIELLNELRGSLISEAVTGKLPIGEIS